MSCGAFRLRITTAEAGSTVVELSLAPEPGSASRRRRERGCVPSGEQALLTAAGNLRAAVKTKEIKTFQLEKLRLRETLNKKTRAVLINTQTVGAGEERLAADRGRLKERLPRSLL